MAKAAFDYSTLDPNRPASFKQIQGVGAMFSGEGFTRTQDVDWPQANRVVACIREYHSSRKPITHGEIQKLRAGKVLPKKYRDLFDESKIGMNAVSKPAKVETKTPTVDLNDPEALDAAIKALIAQKAALALDTSVSDTPANAEGDSEPGDDF